MHGGHGTFLSSLAALSILTLTSHHPAHQAHSTLILHHSRAAARLVPAPRNHHILCREHGTHVQVHDLFGNMPVRVKQRAFMCDEREQQKLWEKLSNQLVALILAWGRPVTLALKNPEGIKKLSIRGSGDPSVIPSGVGYHPNLFDISIIRSVLSQAGYIEPIDWSSWIETSVLTSSVSIRGAISLQPAPSKRVQFISLGIHHVDSDLDKFIYDEVNHKFASSDFGKLEGNSEIEESPRKGKDKQFKQSGFTTKQLKGGGKSADRWPMFFIRIDLLGGPNRRLKRHFDWERESSLLDINCALGAMITGFLNDHHFRPHAKRQKLFGKTYNLPSHSPSKDRSVAKSPHASPAKGSSPARTCSDTVSSPGNHQLPPDRAKMVSSNHSEDSENGVNLQRKPVFGSIQRRESMQHNLYFENSFSTWSRIKSGKSEKLDDMLSQQYRQQPKRKLLAKAKAVIDHTSFRNPLNEAKDPVMKPMREAAEHSEQNEDRMSDHDSEAKAMSHNGASPEVDPVGTIDTKMNHAPEEIIEWTNPISGAVILLSARTGLEVRRPRAASESEIMMSHTQNRRLGKPMIINGLSDPLANLKEDSWVSKFLKSWNNPVFKLCEESIPLLSFEGHSDASSGSLHGRLHPCSDFNMQKAFTESSSFSNARFSKDALSRSTFIAQVDRKFILVCMHLSTEKGETDDSRSRYQRFLVLIDQHAADERIRVEGLLAGLCRGPTQETSVVEGAIHPQSAIATMILAKPITFTIRHSESSIFRTYAFHFAEWGILYSLGPPTESKNVQPKSSQLTVRALPETIAERCRADTKLLIDLLRTEVWKCKDVGLGSKISAAERSSVSPSPSSKAITCDAGQGQACLDWPRRIGNCPRGILDMINSRACRSAIMFNDALTGEECKVLLKRLAQCAFPFQCAHGRPSMVPLVRLGEGEGDGFGLARRLLRSRDEEGTRDVERDFRGAWKSWMEERKRGKEDIAHHEA